MWLLAIGFVVLLLVGVPIALIMGISSALVFLTEGSLNPIVMPQRLFNGIDSFPLMAVPFFILAADLMTAGRITAALLNFSNALVGHIRGGLGHVNVLVSMFFAGISGSALADAAGPGAVAMRIMRKGGYPSDYAAALSAATATIGPIIPPSIIMVIYAISDDRVTVAGLFLAGIVPGILLALALAGVHQVLSVRRRLGTPLPRQGLRARLRSALHALPALLMPLIILGGILSGVFTATEAAAVAVFYGLVVGFGVTRTLRLADLPGIFVRSGILTAAVLLIVAMASIFSWLLTINQVPQAIADLLTELPLNTLGIMVVLAVFVFICGLFIDTLPAVILLTPILSPIAFQVGIDPLHFAMMLVLNLAVGMATPPIGPVLFVMSTVGSIRLERLAWAILPLLVAEIAVLALIVLIPEISLFVPRLFGFAG